MAISVSVLKSMHWRDKQEFHESNVVRWKEVIKRALPLKVSEIFHRVLEASDPHMQLSDIRKLDTTLHQLLLSDGFPDEVLKVLVEMHSLCCSRHPVQRAISSVLQRFPQSQLCRIVKCIGATIAEVISGQWIPDSKILQYIEALMENFPSGENALMERLPLVVGHCVSVISSYSQDNTAAESLLILAMKVTMNVLHKMSPVLNSLLDSPHHCKGDSTAVSIVWPDSLAEMTVESRCQWMQQQLQHIDFFCENLLQTAARVPHDVIITGAMLHIVAVVARFDKEGLKRKIEEMTHKLLEKDSGLLPFAQLATCHAMLAKLPSFILIGEIIKRKPLLLSFFPMVCKLFESFSESSDRYIASRTLALWTSVAKDCVDQILPGSLVYESLLPSGDIVQTLLQFVWTLWEDPIDTTTLMEVQKAVAITVMGTAMMTWGHSICKAAQLAADVTGYCPQVTRGWAFDYFTSFNDIFKVTPENVTSEDIELHLSSARGRGSLHPQSLIFDEQFQLDARCFVWSNAFKKGEPNLTIAMFADWIHTTQNVKVSKETAPSWLHDLGFSQLHHPKGVYFDGHDRADLVERREQFLATLADLDKKTITPDSPAPVLSEGLAALGNDESTYYANCDQTYFWGDDLTNVIKQKSLGSSLMRSDFVDETVGFLQDNLAEARITLATSRNGYFNNELVTLHLIPGIRHQCNEMFDNVIRISLKLPSGDFLQSLAKTLLSLETPTRGKYILLTLLAQHVPVSAILDTSPDLPQELLRAMGHQVLACHAGELWSRLITLHWQSLDEDKLDTWYETWVTTLVYCMCCRSPLARQHTIQYCLPSLLRQTSNCILYINQSLEACSEASAESKLITQLACLRCAKNERKDFIWEESYNGIFSVAMHHADEQVRISALGLLCESHRTTEPPQLSSLPLVLQFMELNANSQSPGFRYPVLTAIKKLLIRIKDSSYALVKQHQKGRAASPKEVIAAHQAFLHRVLEQQFIALNPISSYQRRNFVISILQLLSTIFPDQSPDVTIPPVFEFGSAISKPQTRCLLNSLQDSYDPNRAGALELLLKVPQDKLGLEDVGFLKQCANTYYRLVTSPKAVNCTTASFLLQLFVCRRGEDFKEALKAVVEKTLAVDDKPDEKAPQFATIRILYKIIQQHISKARENLVYASINAPMYGVLQSIRPALKEAISRAPLLAVFSTYQEVTAEIISVCETVASIVSPVVCNSSPEGFLPEASSQLESSQMAEGAPSTGNAQSLLLCCWHSMKEISLLLGFIVESCPDAQNEDHILTDQQLDTIASIFIHQLTEARHRGAFEMAYTGFSKLCQYLWRSPSHDLHAKVLAWVEELLDSLQSTSLTKILNVTRRSAGLPFYLQAILCAEPSHTGRQCLKTTMKTLLRVAKSYRTLMSPDASHADISSTEAQHQSVAVHALNILRALFKDSRLGETIVPFIPDGVMIAIEGFAAAFWPIRNSSTLLFSALFTRIFGAKRAQDEHSMENKITAKEFFSRFPTLYQFLLHQLQTSVHLLESQERRCISCGEWKGRVLISRAIMPMVTAVNVEPLIREVISQLNLKNQNQLHGLLLIVERMIADHSKFLLLDCNEHLVAHLLLHLLLDNQVISSDQNPCVATRALYLDILVSVVEYICERKLFDGVTKQDEFKLVQEAESDPKEPTLSPNLFIARTRLLLLLTQCFDELISVNDIYCKCLGLRNQAIRLFALEHINTKESAASNIEAICPIIVKLLWNETSEDVLAQAYTFLANAVETVGSKCLKYYDSGGEHDHVQFVHRALAMAGRKYIRVELQISLIHFISVALTSAEDLDDSKNITAFLAVLEATTAPTKPVELHIAVATELSGLWKLILRETGNASAFCRLVVQMLQDVDPDVREEAASSLGFVLQSLPQGHSLSDPLLLLQNPNAPSVLKWFLKMISVTLPREMVLDILLGLLSLEDKQPMEKSSSNLLFDEDCLNDYMEEVILTQNICDCIEDFIRTHHSVPSPELQSLVEKLALQLQSILPECSFDSPWEKQITFVYICKVLLLSRALLHSLDAHCVVTLKKVVSSFFIEHATLHPIFHTSGFI